MLKVDVLVGMQYGSEGKGKIVGVIGGKYDACMRVQSIQAGHTVWKDGNAYKLRTIPCAFVHEGVDLLIGPGAFISLGLLESELEMLRSFDVKRRLYVDFRATILDEDSMRVEEKPLVDRIGSTGEGSGIALSKKIMREKITKVIHIEDWFRGKGIQIADTVYQAHERYKSLLVEGAQGTLLSIHTGPYYPFCTARECTASGILSETGFPPNIVRHVIGVMRTYPIRVGGNSGPTGGAEISWGEVEKRCGAPEGKICEWTTVTKRIRRVFEFSHENIELSLMLNRPDVLCLTFADYIDWNVRKDGRLTGPILDWIQEFERLHGYRIDYISTSETDGCGR